MAEMISYCGQDCGACPLRIASLEKNAEHQMMMRAEIAGKLTVIYKKEIHAGEITDCDGCKADGKLFNGCSSCPIRMCASQCGVDSCALCGGYGCAKLEAHLAIDPLARARLEQIRNSISPPAPP